MADTRFVTVGQRPDRWTDRQCDFNLPPQVPSGT